MRSMRLLAVATTVVMLASACGGGDDGGTGVDENDPPAAAFTEVCTELSCVFTDASTDPDGNATITAWSWNFGDNTPLSSTQSPPHVFPAAGTYTVQLTVTDDEGVTNQASKPVTVTATVPGNTAPTANFEVLSNPCVAGTPCGFHSTSTDPDVGATMTGVWDFGDLTETETGLDVTHTFAVPGTYNVILTVTDNAGAVDDVTLPITVTAPALQDCTTTGTLVDCTLTVGVRSTVTFTVVSESCVFAGNRLEITGPNAQIVFFNLCNQLPGNSYTLQAGGTDMVVEAGTQLTVHFVRGTPGPEHPPASDPGIQVDGSSPDWTLNIDDGGLAGTAGEPDFNDVIIGVHATPAP